MSNAVQQTLSIVEDKGTGSDKKNAPLRGKISSRQSQELIIGFSGPAGSGIDTVIEKFDSVLATAGYTVVIIKLSSNIKNTIDYLNKTNKTKLKSNLQNLDFTTLTPSERYQKLQDAGNFLREEYEYDILAQQVIKEIIFMRMEDAKPEYDKKITDKEISTDIDLIQYSVEHYIPKKTAYLIDQLKHDAEVELLKDVYKDLFYLIGNLCLEDERKQNLKTEGISAHECAVIMERDRRENEPHGQQMEKTLKNSDYFVRTINSNHDEIEKQVKRFVDIIHRTALRTPTVDEYGMYIAYSAGLKSACLSRQVGACITDKYGQVISTGCNDVPKFDGGLYNATCETDLRCYNKGGKCYNDDYKKRKIQDEIKNVLESGGVENSGDLVAKIYSSTRLKYLIEFSRSIHAEMDAITSLAKNGGPSTQGATLYTTVFPCHNCARHIIAAGIHHVVYIEPYEKSLAIELHGDEISLEADCEGKVKFSHFVGASPLRYQDFFISNGDRKDEDTGILTVNAEYTLKQRKHPFLDSYRTLETKVVEHLNTKLPSDGND